MTDYLAAALAGAVGAFINTIAGSGSLVTLPMLLFLGLPASVANGTNRLGILLQSLVAMASFHRHGALDAGRGLRLLAPVAVGSVMGALIAVDLDERTLRLAIGVLMVLMLGVLLVRPERWLRPAHAELPVGLREMLLFLGIGVYGGFIQAGVGVFLLAGLVLGVGFDLVKANGVKSILTGWLTLVALPVFMLHDQVVWGLGLAMGAGSMVGAWIAARMAIQRGAAFVHWVLVVVVAVSAADLLGLTAWIRG